MNEYRDEFRAGEREFYWSLPRIVIAVAAIGMLAGSIAWIAGIASQPARIASKTFDADNVIQNYEWFHDAYGNFQAKTAQVHQFKMLAGSETDTQERSRLRIEMAAVQQSCRDLARRYNANATKINRTIFKGRSAPDALDAGDCE